MEKLKNRQIKKTIILTVVFALLITLLGFLNLWKISTNSVNKEIEQKIDYIKDDPNLQNELQGGYSSEELFTILNKYFQENEYLNNNGNELLQEETEKYDVEESDTTIYIYDTKNNVIIGDDEKDEAEIVFTATSILNLKSLPYNSVYYYISDFDGNNEIIYRTSVIYSKMGTTSAIEVANEVTAAAVVVMVLFLIFAISKKKSDKNIVKGLKAIGTIWIITASLSFLIIGCTTEVINDLTNMNAIENEIDGYVEEIKTMPEVDARATLDSICNGSEAVSTYVDSKNCTDVKEKLLYAKSYSLINPEMSKNNIISDITFKDNIWDSSYDILDRIDSDFNDTYIVNEIVSNALISIMFITLYIILISLVPNVDETEKKIVEKSTTTKLKRIIFLKNIADGLMSVVAMAIFTSVLSGNYSKEMSDSVKNITLTLAGLIAFFAVVITPYLTKLIKDTKWFLVITFSLCIIGCCCCLNTSSAIAFSVGYIIISLGESLIVNMSLLHPMREAEEKKNGFTQMKAITNEGRVGSLFGMVAGGVVGSFLPLKFSYIMTIILLVICLIISLTFPKVENKGVTFEYGEIKKTILDKSYLPAYLLLAVPYGFLDYTIKIIVPLNIADMGLTTTLVSFILFLRPACIYFFKNSKKSKEVWKKKDTRFNVITGMFTTAAILVCYYFVKNIYIMLLLTVILAFLRAGMNKQVRTSVLESSKYAEQYYAGSSFLIVSYGQISKTIAPTISSISVCLLPAIMAFGTGAYAIISRGKKKEDL